MIKKCATTTANTTNDVNRLLSRLVSLGAVSAPRLVDVMDSSIHTPTLMRLLGDPGHRILEWTEIVRSDGT